MSEYDNPVTEYWMQNYLDSNTMMCTLCGQSGIIHTEGIRTPAGLEVGRKNFCICPNGQALRKNAGSLTPRAADGATGWACECGFVSSVDYQKCRWCGKPRR